MNLDLLFIKQKRKDKKLSLQKMADLLGIKTASSYLKYETGTYKFKAQMLPVLAKALDCDIKNFYN